MSCYAFYPVARVSQVEWISVSISASVHRAGILAGDYDPPSAPTCGVSTSWLPHHVHGVMHDTDIYHGTRRASHAFHAAIGVCGIACGHPLVTLPGHHATLITWKHLGIGSCALLYMTDMVTRTMNHRRKLVVMCDYTMGSS